MTKMQLHTKTFNIVWCYPDLHGHIG